MTLTYAVWDVGFRYTYLPEGFIEEWNAVYSENALVALPLNLRETPKQKHLRPHGEKHHQNKKHSPSGAECL